MALWFMREMKVFRFQPTYVHSPSPITSWEMQLRFITRLSSSSSSSLFLQIWAQGEKKEFPSSCQRSHLGRRGEKFAICQTLYKNLHKEVKADNSWNHAKKRRDEVKGICSFSFILFFGSSRERKKEDFQLSRISIFCWAKIWLREASFTFFPFELSQPFFAHESRQRSVSNFFLYAFYVHFSSSFRPLGAKSQHIMSPDRAKGGGGDPDTQKGSPAFLHEQNALLILFSCSIRLTSDFVRTLITSVESVLIAVSRPLPIPSYFPLSPLRGGNFKIYAQIRKKNWGHWKRERSYLNWPLCQRKRQSWANSLKKKEKF